MEYKNRKSHRIQWYDYGSSGAYFLTICTKERKNYFWTEVGAPIGRPYDFELSSYGLIVDKAIKNISDIYSSISVDNYVIMPDHIHILLIISNDSSGRPMAAHTMSRIIRQEGQASKALKKVTLERVRIVLSKHTSPKGKIKMTENKVNYRALALEAIGAMEKSYSPYSNFTVGAALLTKEGKKLKGVLKDATAEDFVVTVSKKEKKEGAKRPVLVEEDLHFTYDSIKYTKYIINFK